VKNLLLILYVCPMIMYGQISFIKSHRTNAYVERIARPYELSNGNFICSAHLIDNTTRINVLYLFSECGELLNSLLVSLPSEYMYITNFIQLDSNRVLATGYVYDSLLYHTLYLILDIHSFEFIQEKSTYETNLYEWDSSILLNETIFQVGYGGYGPVVSRLNNDLQRNLHLYRDFENFESQDFQYFDFIKYVNSKVYSIEGYRNSDYITYSILRCLDSKLRECYSLNGKTDSSYIDFSSTIGFLGNDTFLIGATERNLNGDQIHKYVRKYFMDSLLFSREVEESKPFFEYSACEYQSSILKCVNYYGEIGWFNSQGDQIFYDNHLQDQLDNGDLISYITTKDGGLFSVAHDYELYEGHWVDVLKLIKTTFGYQINALPDQRCIVGTENVYSESEVILYPNPANESLHVKSEEDIYQYRIFSVTGKLLLSGKVIEKEFEIIPELKSGYYAIQLKTKKGWIVKKFVFKHY